MDKTLVEKAVAEASGHLSRIREEIGKRIIGQTGLIDGILMALIAGGHVLIEGVPGLAKTLAVKTLAEVLDASYRRIQFTPDLLPADLIGTMVYRQQTGEFVPRKGPVFANLVLGDEINRAPAKVQSALLEAMAERQVTLGERTYKLDFPFFVLATQNPIEHEGTYPLPEAQLDRFLLKLKVEYPKPEEELAILRRMGVEQDRQMKKILSPALLAEVQKTAAAIQVDERIEEYIVTLVIATRETDADRYPYCRFIEYGASPRATIYLYRCAKVKALYEGRAYVIPEDVKAVAYDVLRHRLVLSYEAESEELTAEDVIQKVLDVVHVP
ncbi:MAG: MoxR family ATPase [Spirochaetales bacterium]|nr:MoxR family ATPase [Spirochaetales bacterium]